jgi:hypothetical protein
MEALACLVYVPTLSRSAQFCMCVPDVWFVSASRNAKGEMEGEKASRCVWALRQLSRDAGAKDFAGQGPLALPSFWIPPPEA